MISGQLFGILLLNLIVDGLGDTEGTMGISKLIIPMEGTTGFPMEDSTGPPMEDSGNDMERPGQLMEDYEDSTPFQCNGQNLPGGSDKPSSKARSKSALDLLLFKVQTLL